MDPFDIPIALIIFNRPDCAAKIIARVREIKPARLFIIADGPRSTKPGEDSICQKTRETVERAIDWKCDVVRDYADQNLGCGTRLPTGLTNMFERVERAIILEDDVLPDPSFFPFCRQMLEQHALDERVMQVGAYNRFQYSPNKQLDYFYSRFSDIWGWATWKRAWDKFNDFDKAAWGSIREKDRFETLCYSKREVEMRRFCLDQIFSGELSAWGMRWDTTKLLNHGLGVVPSKNLAVNIGFGVGASHTVNPLNPHRFKKAHGLEPPYQGPANIASDQGFDEKYNRKMFPNNVLTEKARAGILKLIGKK